MAKKPLDLPRGECFSIAWAFSNLSDGIVQGSHSAFQKGELDRAKLGVVNALHAIRDLKLIGHFKKELEATKKELWKYHKILGKKNLTVKDRKDVGFGLGRLHAKVFKDIYYPARVGCGLPRK